MAPPRDRSPPPGKTIAGVRRSPLGGRCMTENLDSRRLDLVRAAQQQWIAALTDLGGRNTLLYYKDRRPRSPDPAPADPPAPDRVTRAGPGRMRAGLQSD